MVKEFETLQHNVLWFQSGMEKQLDEAVAAGDFDKAEEISESLSKRHLACKIAKAADIRDYVAWKKVSILCDWHRQQKWGDVSP